MSSARALEVRAPLRMLAGSTNYCACAGPALSGNTVSTLRKMCFVTRVRKRCARQRNGAILGQLGTRREGQSLLTASRFLCPVYHTSRHSSASQFTKLSPHTASQQ